MARLASRAKKPMKINMAPNTKEEIIRVERFVEMVIPKKWNSSTPIGLSNESQRKNPITTNRKLNKIFANIFYGFPFSSLVSQGTQYFATGRTSSRLRLIGPPHSSQIP